MQAAAGQTWAGLFLALLMPSPIAPASGPLYRAAELKGLHKALSHLSMKNTEMPNAVAMKSIFLGCSNSVEIHIGHWNVAAVALLQQRVLPSRSMKAGGDQGQWQGAVGYSALLQ